MIGRTCSSPSSVACPPTAPSRSVENQLNPQCQPQPVPPCPKRQRSAGPLLLCKVLESLGSHIVNSPPSANVPSDCAKAARLGASESRKTSGTSRLYFTASSIR